MSPPAPSTPSSGLRFASSFRRGLSGRLIGALVIGVGLAAAIPWLGTWRIRAEIRQACEPGNSAIEAVAAVIRRQQATPLEEVALVELAANHLLDFDLSGHVYGPGVPTVSEMLSRRRSSHWLYPHGDCKEHAVIAGSLLSALHIPWEPVLSFPLGHAWVRVQLPNGEWDIMSAPLGKWAEFGAVGLKAVSILAGGSAVPIRSPSEELVQRSTYRLITQPLTAAQPSWRDAATLGVLIVTPRGIYNHAPVDYAELGGRVFFGDAFRQAKVSGFPFGEPL